MTNYKLTNNPQLRQEKFRVARTRALSIWNHTHSVAAIAENLGITPKTATGYIRQFRLFDLPETRDWFTNHWQRAAGNVDAVCKATNFSINRVNRLAEKYDLIQLKKIDKWDSLPWVRKVEIAEMNPCGRIHKEMKLCNGQWCYWAKNYYRGFIPIFNSVEDIPVIRHCVAFENYCKKHNLASVMRTFAAHSQNIGGNWRTRS